MSAIIDMRTWGRVNDATFDNTPALVGALTRRDAGEPLELFFPAGDWHFTGPLPVGTHSNLSIFDNVTISGVYSATSVQHQEDGGGRRTRFIINLTDDSHIWWNHVRANRFGPLAFRDATFQLSNKGSLFAFGDPTNPNVSVETLRGLRFERCYLSRLKLYGSLDIGDGRAWLIDAGTKGFVLNRASQNFAVRMHNCYDSEIDLYIRGFRYGVINQHGDRVRGSLRGITIGKLLEESGVAGVTAPVGSHWQSLYAEQVLLTGAVVTGQVGQLRAEYGYDGIFDSAGVPRTGPRDMPAAVTWSIAVNASTVPFTFPGGWGYDCRDYFEPRLCYRFTPTSSTEPPRWLYVTKVEANQLTFADPTSKSYIPRPISGNGAGVLRPFATGCILDGDRASLLDPSIGCNASRSNSPILFARPGSKPIKVGGNAEQPNKNPTNVSNLPVVVASSAGLQSTLQGGVDFLGSAEVPKHPLANPGGVGPRYEPQYREPLWNPHTRTQLFRPGRGVTGINNESRDLTFHAWGDPEDYIGSTAAYQVNATVFTPLATEFDTNITGSDDSSLIGRSIIFTTTNALNGLVANIYAYRLVGSLGRLTVFGLPTAPAGGNSFRVIGPPTPCYRPSDNSDDWVLRRLRRSGVETRYTIRVYVPDGTPSLNVYGGNMANTHPLVGGWQTIFSRLTAANMVDDPTGPFIAIGAGIGVYVAWAEIDQEQPSKWGVYTPTFSDPVNVTGSFGYESQYLRVGRSVTVSGKVDVTVTAALNTLLTVSLPIASNFGAAENCAGTANTVNTGENGIIFAETVNNAARLQFIANFGGMHTVYFHFTYRLIP